MYIVINEHTCIIGYTRHHMILTGDTSMHTLRVLLKKMV